MDDEEAECPQCGGELKRQIDDETQGEIDVYWVCFDCGYEYGVIAISIQGISTNPTN